MEVKQGLLYTKTHEWVKFLDDSTALVGISDHAQHELGDLVFVNLPEVGTAVTAGELFGDVESVKAVSDVIAPVSGTVAEINEVLLDKPEKINESAYAAWFIKVEAVTARGELMDADTYAAYCNTL
jgi:glycine cleavage system H protein